MNLTFNIQHSTFNIQHSMPICIQESQLAPALKHELSRMQNYLSQLQYELDSPNIGQKLALRNWISLIFLQALRFSETAPIHIKNCQSELDIFRKFNALIEDHFKEHWTLNEYANVLAVTETSLNDICKTLANISSKKNYF